MPQAAPRPEERAAADAPIETPAHDDTPPQPEDPHAKWTFAACEMPPEAACAPGTICVEGPENQARSCVPVVRQEDLEKPLNWNHPVVIEAPRIAKYDRKLTCKSKQCGFPGASLPLDKDRFLAIEFEKGGVWTHGSAACGPGAWGNHPGCPDYPTARMLGVVHSHTVPGQTGTLLTFQLLGVEPPKAAMSSALPQGE